MGILAAGDSALPVGLGKGVCVGLTSSIVSAAFAVDHLANDGRSIRPGAAALVESRVGAT